MAFLSVCWFVLNIISVSALTHFHHDLFHNNQSIAKKDWQNLTSICPFGFEIEGEMIRCAIPSKDFPKINLSSIADILNDEEIPPASTSSSPSLDQIRLDKDRQMVLNSKYGPYFRHHFLNLVLDRPVCLFHDLLLVCFL
jgi:hypothetical protein